MKFNVRKTKDSITASVIRQAGEMRKVPAQAHNFFVKATPVDTGNARSRTKLTRNTIRADYNYAKVLDKGRHSTPRGMRGSRQAPQGMTRPTAKFIERLIRQKLRK
jgi:hypothetical protein